MEDLLRIIKACSPEHLEWIKTLFREYVGFLGNDLSFQNFEQELARLPGYYGPPAGDLLLALYNGKPAGCVAVRRITSEICEMKRLFVRPEYRKYGIGKALALEIIASSRRLGYQKMRLDSLTTLADAVKLYRKLGFYEIEAYCHNPLAGAVFMELDLENKEDFKCRLSM